ncbi:hypothetical protein BgiMline_028997 [Biomphalaria glabrata]|nr:hypothetical protein BgiMline_025629 [Biomphalaria glabrata]
MASPWTCGRDEGITWIDYPHPLTTPVDCFLSPGGSGRIQRRGKIIKETFQYNYGQLVKMIPTLDMPKKGGNTKLEGTRS